ncbi:MAG: YpdA family putative bacillithiol disulfide reductase [Nonlabens sp.]
MSNKGLRDVIIIGGGPIGIACAMEAQDAGFNYLVIEKGALVNSLFNYPTNMQFFSTSEKLELHNVPFISKEAKPSKQEALEYYRRIATSRKLHIHLYEKVIDVTTGSHYVITTDKAIYHSKNLVLATGFYDLPNRINVSGEDLPKVSHYYDDPHKYAFQDVVIVGASNSAVDAALEIYRKGGRVTMIIRGKSIGTRVKYWVKPDIENRIKEGAIQAYFNSEITRITHDAVYFKKDEHSETRVANDFVLALTGYRPDFHILEKLGVELSGTSRIPTYDKYTMETNVEGLYLAGVICGGLETSKWFIENSRDHARLIMQSCLNS